MESADLLEFQRFAERIAAEAGKVTLDYFGGAFEVERKADKTPVTIADRKCEEALRRMIETEFPHHGILGEEFGETGAGAEYRWIIDPIDGTKPFVAGVPQYTVLVALERLRDGVVGVIHSPPLKRTLSASVGNGCYLNGEKTSVSTVSRLRDAAVLTSSYADLIRTVPEASQKILSQCRTAPGWGDAFGYMLVAQGKCDLMLDARLALWDAAPLKVCIEESGGRFTDWNGNATIYVENGLAGNPNLHQQTLEILGSGK